MNIIGIICEYNPLHNGHIYHINEIKKLYKDSIIILVLNGYFLERGDISILNKESKTKLALNFGVDIVVELPFVFGTQSADTFASASIKILNYLGCDHIVFGSESNNIDILEKIVDYQINNKDKYDEKVKKLLNNGENYPTALAKSLNIDFNFKPNDLLGISYIKAIKQNNYNIKYNTIKRTNDYLDNISDNDIVSASNIRERYYKKEDIKKYIPSYDINLFNDISLNNYFDILKYKINTDKDLSIYLDVDEGIHNRLKKVINEVDNINELIEMIKSKRYTYNKIKRMLVHILIGFTKKDNDNLDIDYIKILGFNKTGKNYLNKKKKELNGLLNVDKNTIVYKYELLVANIYQMYVKEDCISFEKRNEPIQL